MSSNEKKIGRPKKENSKFNEVFRKLVDDKENGEETQDKIAKKIGVSRQNVGKWLSYDNPTTPDIITLGKIADAYNVSTDYLLDRTDVKSPQADKRAVCDYTGLSQEAVEELVRLRDYEDDSLASYDYEDVENHLQMIGLINIFIGTRFKTKNIDGKELEETYFSLIMQTVLQYIETIYSNSSGIGHNEKLMNNVAKWEAVEIFIDFLNEVARQITNDLKEDKNNGNS